MKGQIIKILSNLYFVNSNNSVYECHSRGKFRNDKITPLVGDYVEFSIKDKYILKILPRKNHLIRPMVANVDQGIIVTSLKKPDFSTNLLDKLLLILEYNKIKPIICFTKKDLLNNKELEDHNKYSNYYKSLGYTIYYNDDLEPLKRIFKNKITFLVGQTGAGKSSLLNRLDSKLNLATGEISKALGRGKHTTRHVELIELFDGKLVDTPGFSMIDLTKLKAEDIKNGFIEFNEYNCKYKDCNHINEKECMIKQMVNEGKILSSRYENYKKFVESIEVKR